MTCPRCAASEISAVTGKCYLCGFALEAGVAVESTEAISELATRQLAHEFKFGELIGTGRDSAVFRAREGTGNRDVVVKATLRRNDNPESAETFRATMTAFAALDHPHLVPILRFGSTDSLFWTASDDRHATSLRARLTADGRMDLRAVRRMVTQLASALEFLHRRGLVHGAVKPENVLIDANGWVGLADPNITRPRPKRPSRPTPIPGAARVTPVGGIPVIVEPPSVGREAWISPEEHARGERTSAADQFCLAALAYECLTAQPFTGAARPLLEIRPDLPPQFGRAIERALSGTPAQRFASCGEFLFALDEDAVIVPAAPAAIRPMSRVTAEVAMVRDWEPPPDPRAKLFRGLRIGAGVALGAALLLALPALKEAIAPSAPSVQLPATGPAATPSTAPVTSTPTTAAPERSSQRAPQPAPERVPDRAPVRTAERPAAAPRPAAPRSTAPSPTAEPTAPAATPTPAPRRQPTAPATAPATADGSAKLFVNAQPWGQVFVDGTSVGNTPRANLTLTPGTHVIRVSREGFTSWERTVRVTAGETLRFTDIVLEPVP